MGFSNKPSCEVGVSFATLTPTGFEALFPSDGTMGGCMVCLVPQLFLPVFQHANVRLPHPPAAALPGVLSILLPIFTLPSSLNECFSFDALVVGLPYSLTVWQFWLFFVLKFVVFLLLVV